MKYLFISLLSILTITANTFSQVAQHTPKLYTREALLKRSHEQTLGACVLLGSGILAIALVSNGNQDFGTTGAVAILGGAAILGSIPLFFAAGRNKRRALRMDALLEYEPGPVILTRKKFGNKYPALAVSFKLTRS